MYQPFAVDYLNMLLSFSDAIDLASESLARHQIRTAFICWEMAKVYHLGEKDIDDLFVAALMHDVGALSPEEKINIHRVEVFDPEPHCILGERLMAGVPGYARISKIIRHHHMSWQDLGRLSPEDAVLAQILNLADCVERAIDRDRFILHQVDDIFDKVDHLSGSIMPHILPLLRTVAVREDFWLDVMSQRIYSLLLHSGPCRNRVLDLDSVKNFAGLIRNMIDFRSHFTATHSAGVTASAVALAEYVGMTEMECDLMEIAGGLHDLGKLAVPNGILMKPDKLTPDEFAIMRQHTYFTYTVLMSIGGMQQIAEWAAFHHERLDGNGYPFHVGANKIGLGARIMAVADVLTALSEDRPYRVGMPRDKVMEIIREQVDSGALDARIVDILQVHYGEILDRMEKAQCIAHDFFSTEFMPLMCSVRTSN